MKKEKDDITRGILLIDKPIGLSSHDIVNAVRKRYGFAKVGHAGTLDPMATGLLILLIGRDTKRCLDFINDDKTYETILKLGVETETGDALGKITSEKPFDNLTEKEIEDAVCGFKGEIEQVPPMFSAKRHKGKKLYQYARKGIEVERSSRKITILEIGIENICIPFVSVKVTCSKGTYIRQLAVDIGRSLGCGAHITELRRTVSGDKRIENAFIFDSIMAMEKKDLLAILDRF